MTGAAPSVFGRLLSFSTSLAGRKLLVVDSSPMSVHLQGISQEEAQLSRSSIRRRLCRQCRGRVQTHLFVDQLAAQALGYKIRLAPLVLGIELK